MFVLSGVLVALGALSPAAVAIIAPIGMAFAARYRINPLLMGLMVIHGSAAGNFSPLGVLGVITNGIVDRSDLPGSPIGIFVANLIFNIALGVIIYVAFGGLQLLRSGARCAEHTETDLGHDSVGGHRRYGCGRQTRGRRQHAGPTTRTRGNGCRFGGVGTGRTRFRSRHRPDRDDRGRSCWRLLSPQTAKVAVADISWGVVLLICGIVTYVGFLSPLGTVDYIGHAIASVSAPLLAALVLLYVGSVVSAFASTTGILGALIPLAVPLLAAGELGAVAVVAALSISASVVDSSPFSTNGALVVANAPARSGGRGLPRPDGLGLRPGRTDATRDLGDLRPSGVVTVMTHMDRTRTAGGRRRHRHDHCARRIRRPAVGGSRRRRHPLRRRGTSASPHRRAFMNAGKQIRSTPPRDTELERLLQRAHCLSPAKRRRGLRARGLHPDDVTRRHPCSSTSRSARSASPDPMPTARPATSP